MKKLITTLLLLAPVVALAAGGGPLYPDDPADLPEGNQVSLQKGARTYMNYCMGCHSMKYQRYQSLVKDLGLKEEVVQQNLIFDDSKLADLMTNAMPAEAAANWFGTTPPDLTLVGRVRGADWLYNYLRGFYRDDSRPYGFNNTVFKDVGMPHVLVKLQGVQVLNEEGKLELVEPGLMTPEEYDDTVRNLVNFLDYVGEPIKQERKRIGVFVLLFILVFFVIAYFLKKEYWKDIH